MSPILTDIAKAYDTTWRYNILRKIYNYGIRGSLVHFIRNFFRDKQFKLKIENTFSKVYTQEEGVPQGSVLSVTLFAIAMDNIVSAIPDDISNSLYVNDVLVYYSAHQINHIERKLQLAMNRVNTWVKSKGYAFSDDKTVVIHFHKKRGMQTEPNIVLNSKEIKFKPHAKFLGMELGRRLYWKIHLGKLRERATKTLSILKYLAHLKWGLDRNTLLRLCHALIRSKIDCGCQFYAPTSQHNINKIKSIHNQAIRICTGALDRPQ